MSTESYKSLDRIYIDIELVMGRKPIQKERSRNEIKREKWVLQCMEHFEESGLKNVTMDTVSEKLGISKATIYNHFKSKEEIIQTAIAMILNDIRHYEDLISDREKPYLMRYYRAIRYYAKQLCVISPKLVADVKELYPKMWAYVEIFRNQFSFVLTKYYEEGINKGMFKDMDINILVGTDRWFLDALLTSDFVREKNLSIETAVDEFFKMKFDGLIASSAAEIISNAERLELAGE